MNWSKEWPGIGKVVMDPDSNPWPNGSAWADAKAKINPYEYKAQFEQQWPINHDIENTKSSRIEYIGIDLGKDDMTTTVAATVDNAGIHVEKVYNNKVPTHDPYTNPDSQIYYQCGCGDILDPGTKSFAALNNAAMNEGWKIRWGERSYQPYCVKCGEGVE